MRRQLIATAAVAALSAGVAAAVTLGGGSASAADITGFHGYAGGSQIKAADSTITSDLSVQSDLTSFGDPVSDSKNTAHLSAGGVLTTGAVSTSVAVKNVTGGHTVTSTARTAGVSLLNGLVSADAVTSVTTSSLVNGVYSSTSKASFLGLHVAGVKLPLTIPQNYGVSIPGVATLSLNLAIASTAGKNTVGIGAGLVITLLKPSGNSPQGASIYVSPTFTNASTSTAPPATGHSVYGLAYATKVSAKAGSTVGITSDPTAQSQIPPSGTEGALKTTGVAGVNIAPALTVGAARTSMTGSNTSKGGAAHTSASIAGISLLGGLIKADAVTASAQVVAATGKATTFSATSGLANLVIAGKKIAVNVKPNTTISLGSLGSVVLNQQARSGPALVVEALHITLSTKAFGLDAGAQIEVAVASAIAT